MRINLSLEKQASKLSSSKPEPSFSKEGVNVVSTKSQTIENFFSINKFDGQIFTLGNKLWNLQFDISIQTDRIYSKRSFA